jgi:hypothetical protein
VDEQDFVAASDDDASAAPVSPDEPGLVARRHLRRDTIVLSVLLVATVVVFGGIAWDAGWVGSGDGLPTSRPTGPNTSATTGLPVPATTAPRTGPSAPPAGNGGGAASGQNGSGSGSTSSGGGRTQGDYARDALTRPAPRPPATSGITQDELDRRREAAEAKVPTETSIMTPRPPTP